MMTGSESDGKGSLCMSFDNVSHTKGQKLTSFFGWEDSAIFIRSELSDVYIYYIFEITDHNIVVLTEVVMVWRNRVCSKAINVVERRGFLCRSR
ncbi:hypothetical protein AVEN_126612-1 [Araneus ventricosus]|uniref:Uncharacterized protein n=1 Tax=Araneus ventricosus TaxID=182803 RepID=A0A4Y2BS11_ARAVE|nr:hypothetical protein AVEN_126612-1 [Araneus ventricosus]